MRRCGQYWSHTGAVLFVHSTQLAKGHHVGWRDAAGADEDSIRFVGRQILTAELLVDSTRLDTRWVRLGKSVSCLGCLASPATAAIDPFNYAARARVCPRLVLWFRLFRAMACCHFAH